MEVAPHEVEAGAVARVEVSELRHRGGECNGAPRARRVPRRQYRSHLAPAVSSRRARPPAARQPSPSSWPAPRVRRGHRRRAAPEGSALAGTVVAVHDGDTLSVRVGGVTERVRLAQIDAPERGQPWGRRAREALARLAARRAARLVVVDRDSYGRVVADVYVGELFVNEALVRDGDAWAYPRYVRSPAILEAEDEARRARPRPLAPPRRRARAALGVAPGAAPGAREPARGRGGPRP